MLSLSFFDKMMRTEFNNFMIWKILLSMRIQSLSQIRNILIVITVANFFRTIFSDIQKSR